MRPSSALVRSSLVAIALLAGLPALAVRAPEPGTTLPDLDARLARNARMAAVVAMSNGVKQSELIAGPVAEPGPMRQAALVALSRSAGPLEVRWDEVTGSPKLLFARHGLLTATDARAPELIARDFVLAHRDLFLLDVDQAKALAVRRVVPTSAGGAVVRLQQQVDGTDVLHGQIAVSVGPDGRVIHVMGGRVTGAGRLARTTPKHDAAQALRVLAAMAGVELAALPAPSQADESGASFRDVKELRGPVRVERVIVPTAGGPRLGWHADLFVAGSPAGYSLVADDATLQPVRRATRTWYLDTRGRVYTNNPGNTPFDEIRFADGVDYRRDTSPGGWTDESVAPLVTIGNNVVVQDDLANDDETTPGRRAQATGPAPYWAFDHPYTTGGAADADASLTNLFYGINWAHDRFHEIGFDEPSGNFQSDNFGRGGRGGDPVLADDRDGSGTNNANFQTPPDGFSGRMQMYLWDISGAPRSSSFETGIVTHELGHGVSTRLVGGPDSADCLFGFQSGSMGEAWSDYFAASFLEDPVIAEWVAGDPAGIRMLRLDENPATGKDYRDFCTYGSDQPPQLCEVHDNGEMWSGLLWLIREQYLAAYGPEGARRADQLVLDGMKYTTCEPSMLDARDALILADRLQTGGQMECVIKSLAASRWMGFDAVSTGGSDTQPAAGDQDWPECVSRGVVRFDRDELEAPAGTRATYGCADSVTVLLTDGNFVPAPDSVTLTVMRAAAEVDRELVSPAAGSGPGAFSASLATTSAPGAPLDGTLNVESGDEIVATYVDLAPGGSVVTASADVSCKARIAVVRHRVLNGSCDADELAGYPELPGFVDAGETADLEVELANLAPTAVQGLLTITSDNPNLTLLPTLATPISFPAAIGSSPASVVVRLKAIASTAVTPGELANVEFAISGPAFVAGPAATLTLQLGMDYEVETGLSHVFDMEGETAPAGPQLSRDVLVPGGGNQWTVVTCANTTPAGTKAYRNGPANCAGRYSDAQGNPYLATPALDFFDATTAAARITSMQWQNDINLGVIGFPPNIPLAIDADAVAVMLTNDPTAVDVTDPIAVATSSVAFYIRVDIPGFFSQDSNTTGFVLDQRAIAPGQLAGVDLSQPSYLAWYFLPDFTFLQPPLDAQGDGYFLDDVRIDYERVRVVPQAAGCTPTAATLVVPVISSPAAGAACSGTLVTVDASASESALCTPALLEYRFLKAGLPVSCLQTDGVTPRAQDFEGWGLGATCSEPVTFDTTYEVEARCQAEPAATDRRPVTVRILDGLPLLTGRQRSFCAGSGTPIVVDASVSSFVGCPGSAEYRFSDAAGLLDCDGDTLPDDYRAASTCSVGPSDVALDVTVEVRCDALPGCELTNTITIPSVSATAVASTSTPAPGGFSCTGSTVTLDASGSVVTGCTGGVAQYRWSSSPVFDSGWISSPTLDVTVGGDRDYALEVRCSLNDACVAVAPAPVSVLERTGEFVLSQAVDADDCAGDLFRLVGGVRNPPGARCAGSIEYRFLLQSGPPPTLTPATCFDDAGGLIPRTGDVDGWGTGSTCFTAHVAGGADFVVEYRCGDDPSCTMETSLPRRITPQTGIPAGSIAGTLRVRKSAPGCVPGSDVRLSWADTDYNPTRFITWRSDDPQVDTATERLALVDDFLHSDAGASCDGGGVPYRGRAVYFYLHAARNTCTDEPLP